MDKISMNHCHLGQIKEMMGLFEALCKPGDVLGTCLFRKQGQLINHQLCASFGFIYKDKIPQEMLVLQMQYPTAVIHLYPDGKKINNVSENCYSYC